MNVVCRFTTFNKHRNSEEYRKVPRLVCDEYNLSVDGDGNLVMKMANALEQAGCDLDRGYDIKRGSMSCFTVVPLRNWLYPPDRRPEWLRD